MAIPLLALLLFPFTELNQDLRGRYSGREDGTWRSLDNYSVIFLESWKVNGPVRTRFGLEVPLDDTDFRFVKPYSSYPAGYLLPAHLLVRATSNGTHAATVDRLGLLARAGHFALSCLAGLTALFLAGTLTAAFAATAAALFLPPLLAFLHNIWWIDMAGLILATAAFLLHLRGSRYLAPMILLGGLVDWFTPMLALPLLCTRNRRRLFLVFGALSLAALAFLLQQYFLSSLHVVLYKFRLRTGIQGEGFTFSWLIAAWPATVERLLGPLGFPLPFVALFLAAAFKEGRRRLALAWPLYAAVILHWLLFNQHYPGHHYNTIRWAYAIVLLPALFPRRFGTAAALCLLAYTVSCYPLFREAVAPPDSDLTADEVAACRLVERHQASEHLFVSTELRFSERVLGYLWYFPICKSTLAEASSMDDVTFVQQKRFVRFGFRVARIERTYLLSKLPAPLWARPAREVDSEPPWRLYELPPL